MTTTTRKLVQGWIALGPRFLPFADAGSPGLPLSRLLRLSLFQVSVGMALVLLVGTLNRVMIVELNVPASLVALMVALPVLYAPFRALVGFRSDSHRSALGWRRVPYIWMGTMLQFGGLAVMPFALLVLSGGGNAAAWPREIGWLGAAIAFLLVGAGMHTVQTAGLALATDQAPAEDRPKVVGLMYVMLLVGSIVSSLLFGALLADFSPFTLVRVIQGAAVATLVLNAVAMWKQESRNASRAAALLAAQVGERDFGRAWRAFVAEPTVRLRLVGIAVGTVAFGMQDVLLEPYGGEVLAMTVGQTTWLSATLAAGGLAGFWFASVVLGRGADPTRMSLAGLWAGVPAFAAVLFAGPLQSLPLFSLGVLFIGVGGGLFGHGTLTATMNAAPREQIGLALGVWGAVQATAAGVGVALGGLLRDLASVAAGPSASPALGYSVVYALEVILLLAALRLLWARSPRPPSAVP